MSLRTTVTKWRRSRLLVCLAAILLTVIFFALCLGGNEFEVFNPIKVLNDPLESSIVFELRLPRILMSFFIGAALSTAGVATQGFFRNSLADPYFLGFSGGASVGAAAGMLFFLESPLESAIIGGFIGSAFIGVLLLMLSAKSVRRAETLLLVGMSFSLLSAAILSMILFFLDERSNTVIFWLMGSLSGTAWREMLIVAIGWLIGWLLLFRNARSLDLNQLGQISAHALGVDMRKFRLHLMASVSLLVTVSVCFTGAIGFVGLVIPHFSRKMMGPKSADMYLTAPIIGGIFLVLCDTLARSIVMPSELPIGVVTGIIGAPAFIYILMRKSTHD